MFDDTNHLIFLARILIFGFVFVYRLPLGHACVVLARFFFLLQRFDASYISNMCLYLRMNWKYNHASQVQHVLLLSPLPLFSILNEFDAPQQTVQWAPWSSAYIGILPSRNICATYVSFFCFFRVSSVSTILPFFNTLVLCQIA